MRQIFVDTETTGFEFKNGHRIIEFGAVEAINRKLTGHNLHFYFKPDIEVEQGAFEVHGISNEVLKDQPLFEEKADEIITYLKDAELIIHNAAFDVPFINSELSRLSNNRWGTLESHCTVIDTLIMARKMYPGQRNSLDALCKRYMIGNSHRTLHGALLDAELLAKVYFAMTGGQTQLLLAEAQEGKLLNKKAEESQLNPNEINLRVISLSEESEKAHQSYLELLDKKSTNGGLWQAMEKAT